MNVNHHHTTNSENFRDAGTSFINGGLDAVSTRLADVVGDACSIISSRLSHQITDNGKKVLAELSKTTADHTIALGKTLEQTTGSFITQTAENFKKPVISLTSTFSSAKLLH